MLWLVELLACFDFLSPILEFFTLARQDTRAFFVPLECGWSGAMIEGLLREGGIKMLAWEVYLDTQFFHVPAQDADQAYHILINAGVPLL